jgi:hypothetical protein
MVEGVNSNMIYAIMYPHPEQQFKKKKKTSFFSKTVVLFYKFL